MEQFILRQRGLSIVELLVAMGISLIIVAAAAFAYLAVRESQRVIDRSSSSRETGAFVLQLLGREIMNAGFYPANVAPIPADPTQQGMYDSYPPLPANPRVATDWQNPEENWPPPAFQSGIFGCAGGQFNTQTSTCPTPNAAAADTLVINYFTSDTSFMGANTGRRFDCTGRDVAPPTGTSGGDPSNDERKKNQGGNLPDKAHNKAWANIPPQLPVFVSNRFTLTDIKMSLEQQEIKTKSLACSGNGKSPHRTADEKAYQPIIAGLEDLKFSYGIYNGDSTAAPTRFYTATQVAILPPLMLNGLTLTPWQRVTAVRVCLLTRTVGGNTRIADKTGSARTYTDCSDDEQTQPARDTITRHIAVFGLRNNLKEYY